MDVKSFLPGTPTVQEQIGLIPGQGDLLGTMEAKPQYLLKSEGGEVAFTTMMEFSWEDSSRLPTEPIEQGSFATYNRIQEPKSATARLAVQGTNSEIQSLLDKLVEMKSGSDFITIVTPFNSYENMMLESFDYRRDSHSGFNLLQVDLKLKEVREVETQQTTSSVEEPEPEPVTEENAADGSCCSEVDEGEYQTYEPSGAESERAEDGESGGNRSSVLHDIFGRI